MQGKLDSFEALDQCAAGFRQAQIVLAAVRLGVFEVLEPGARTADEVAAALPADPRGARILLDALAALGLLHKERGRYRNSALATDHLLPGGSRSRVHQLLHNARLYERWGRLFDAVRSGAPVDDESIDARLRFEPRAFARAMADVARDSAALTAAALELSEVRRLLDVGGGPGLYAIECARRAPELQAVILDGPETLEVAQRNIAAAGFSDRITARAGDAFTGPLGSGYDLILLSNFIHIYSAAQNRALMARCGAALAPGGRLAIKDFLLEPDRTVPLGAALFAVNMLVSTEQGDCYSGEEVREWCAGAGLRFERQTELTPHSSLLIARKA